MKIRRGLILIALEQPAKLRDLVEVSAVLQFHGQPVTRKAVSGPWLTIRRINGKRFVAMPRINQFRMRELTHVATPPSVHRSCAFEVCLRAAFAASPKCCCARPATSPNSVEAFSARSRFSNACSPHDEEIPPGQSACVY